MPSPSPSAHPRACGENALPGDRVRLESGSSPRVRGKRAEERGRVADVGLIPARAGKTSRATATPCTWRAHPRVCGENLGVEARDSNDGGSSPRVRGKHQRGRSLRHARGLIPACAGETTCSHARNLTPKAHPRVCGENVSAPSLLSVHLGSSPRLRGKHRLLRRRDRPLRLIPARAGQTDHGDIQGCRYGAHPRACGENIVSSAAVIALCGSSPRVRGNPIMGTSRVAATGLIPARAGKTFPPVSSWLSSPAHPRACGENDVGRDPLRAGLGSSPRVRGKPGAGPRGGGHGRLIPARAGKTRRPVSR